jgi:acid_CoA_mut_C: methylmalonyl-CoA mutase C-terminal domain
LLIGKYESFVRWYSFEQDVCFHDHEWCRTSHHGILYQCRFGTGSQIGRNGRNHPEWYLKRVYGA